MGLLVSPVWLCLLPVCVIVFCSYSDFPNETEEPLMRETFLFPVFVSFFLMVQLDNHRTEGVDATVKPDY